ncbi:MAG: hypothetical protein JNK05_11975 [Myxococcales bacterium]|nr:hypothetical protein [Myxococcales bacterium]
MYLVVYGSATPFDLSLTLVPSDAPSTCARRAMLLSGVRRTGDRLADAMEPAVSPWHPRPLPALFYGVTVAPGERLDVLILSAETHVSRMFEGCGATSAIVNALFPGTTTRMSWENTSAIPKSVVIAVSRSSTNAEPFGSVDILATLTPPPPLHPSCTSPATLISGVSIRANTADALGMAPTCSSSYAPALFYSIRVPAGQRLLVQAAADSYDMAHVRFLTGCRGLCFGTSGSFEVRYWTNTGATEQDVIVAVGPLHSTSRRGEISLTATLETPVAHGRCASALPVSGTTSLVGQRFVDADELANACAPGERALFYAVTVPPNRRLQVRTSSAPSLPVASIQRGCPGVCLVAGDAIRSRAGLVQWTNDSPTSQTVIVAVSASRSGTIATASFDLDLLVQPIPEAGSCATAPTLTPGSEQPIVWTDASESAVECGVISRSLPSIFYSVDVPAGHNLTATFSGASSLGVGVRILSGCAAPMCLSDSRFAPSWRNTGTMPARVVIALSNTNTSSLPSPGVLTVRTSP